MEVYNITKEEIIEYVMHSPANTNPAVLNSLLEQMGGGSGGGGVYEIEGTLVPDPTAPIESGTIQINATYEQLLSAHNEGKVCIINFPGVEFGMPPMTLGTIEYEGATCFFGDGQVGRSSEGVALRGQIGITPDGALNSYSEDTQSKYFLYHFDQTTKDVTFDGTYETLMACFDMGIQMYYADASPNSCVGDIQLWGEYFRLSPGCWKEAQDGTLFVNYDASTNEYTTVDENGFHPVIKRYDEYLEK